MGESKLSSSSAPPPQQICQTRLKNYVMQPGDEVGRRVLCLWQRVIHMHMM